MGKPHSFLTFIVVILLLLPILYVGSYLALVQPGQLYPRTYDSPRPSNYRWGSQWAKPFFWPLEQVDRKLRPRKWEYLADGKRRQAGHALTMK
jgi:hypothetical protein